MAVFHVLLSSLSLQVRVPICFLSWLGFGQPLPETD